MATKHQLTNPTEGISCHAWNADCSMIAISPNSNEIHIYNTKVQPWKRVQVLTEHDLLVSAIDWSPVHNKIVSCSHDRNAFVWTYDAKSDEWKPALVILRIDRAALDVKWSLDGQRFAVTSGAKCVSVCSYESTNDWWVSKLIKKKFKSTVLCCAFNPRNGQVIATGSADFKCRVYSTFSSDVDGSNVNAFPFQQPVEFGEAYFEFSCLGWVNSVAWSPSGSSLAFTGHDSSLHVATFGNGEPVVQTIRFPFLPLNKIVFLSEKAIVGAGHDMNPAVFTLQKGEWKFLTFVDRKKEESSGASQSTGVAAARALFQNKTSRGQETKSENDVLWTQHEMAISDVKPLQQSATISKISTSSVDGRVVVWDLPALEINVSSLSL